jgi:hypothetical protein
MHGGLFGQPGRAGGGRVATDRPEPIRFRSLMFGSRGQGRLDTRPPASAAARRRDHAPGLSE